jgi:predicted PurR-regulated permease PerM
MDEAQTPGEALADADEHEPAPGPEQGEPEAGAGGAPDEPVVPSAPVAIPPPVVVPRWIQLVLLPLALLGAFELAQAAGTIFVVLVAACVIAMILNPLTKRLQRLLPRGLAIVASYVVVAFCFALVIGVLVEPVANEISHVSGNLPSFVRKANQELQSVQAFLNRHRIKVHIAQQGHSALQSIEKRLLKSTGSIVSFSRDLLGKAVTLGVDLLLTFVLSVYLLVYARPIGELVRKLMPPGDGTPEDDYPLLVQHALFGYMRGQLLFSAIMGGSASLLMAIVGVTGIFPDGSKFALFFGLFYALMELIPYIGPILGPIPPVLVALVTHPVSALWVLLVFIGLQQLEGHVVAPQVFRLSLRINPILVILALLLGYKIFGVAGALLALPVATLIRQTVLYLRKHLVLESWATQAPPL